ncbi:MAG: hypothetical protein ACRDL7_08500 [Gaiellaceae bacterium]
MSTAVETDKMAALAIAANEARGLAMDSIAAAHSGHMGLPLGAAEIGAALWGSQVRTQLVLIAGDHSREIAIIPQSNLQMEASMLAELPRTIANY